MKLNFLAVAAVILCCLLGVALFRAHREAADAEAELVALRAATNALSGEIAQLQSSLPSESERARMAAAEREAIKLRGDVQNLKQSVADAKAAANAAQKKISVTETKPPAAADASENPYARVIGRKLTTNMELGHALVFGGWQANPGKQTFAFAIPKLIPGASDQVEIATKWMELSDDAVSKFDVMALVRAGGQQATLTPDQLAALIKAAESAAGIDLLSAPVVSVSSGRAASISITETRSTPNGPVEFGPVMNVTPTLAADGRTVDLTVDAKLTLPNDPTPAKE